MFLLSVFAGLRAKEVASIKWGMVTDAEGKVDYVINLPDEATKGDSGRTIPMPGILRNSLLTLKKDISPDAEDYIITSERGEKMTPKSVANWFKEFYLELGFYGCSSHSGRRTFGTNTARDVIKAGGSLKDIQELLGHKDIKTTQKYIEGNSEAKRKVVNMMFPGIK